MLLRQGPGPLAGSRVGLITNHTGISASMRGATLEEITAPWPAQLAAFRSRRRAYLLYPEEND